MRVLELFYELDSLPSSSSDCDCVESSSPRSELLYSENQHLFYMYTTNNHYNWKCMFHTMSVFATIEINSTSPAKPKTDKLTLIVSDDSNIKHLWLPNNLPQHHQRETMCQMLQLTMKTVSLKKQKQRRNL